MANTYYTEAELETLLSKSPILNKGDVSALYDVGKYRMAGLLYWAQIGGIPDYQDIDNITGIRKYYSKADTVAVVARYAKTVLKVAISLYNTTPTFAQIVSAIQAEGQWPYLTAYWLAYSVLELWFSFQTEVGSQVLSNPSTFATTWTPANGFSVAGGKLVYAHNAGANTATQAVGDFIVAGVASKWYKFDYTISDVTIVTGVLQISVGFAAVAEALGLTAGKHTAFFISAATLPGAGNFILGATSASGGFKMDDVQLNQLVPAFLSQYDPAGNVIGNAVVMSLEGKQRMAYQMDNACRELRYGELATYGPNPVL